tara:strand:- start:60 stop:287 length:228 start_codon:yes stop_codon:yes gene_type:complete
MQVRFKLPRGGSGIPASMKANHIRGEILLWCAMHGMLFQNIDINRVKGKGLVTRFKDEDDYLLFRITWNGTDYVR